MIQGLGLDRRTFLRRAGTTAVLGAVGARSALPGDPASPAADALANGAAATAPEEFNFDEVYDRRGSDCVKWDRAIRDFGPQIEVGMGIADMDFRAAPCITRALAERCKHENWGYHHRDSSFTDAVVAWNQRRYGLDIDPATIVWTTGVHPGVIAGLHTFAPPGSRVLLTTPTYNGFYTDLRFSRTIAEDCEMKEVDGRYEIDWDDFERRAQRVQAFILCNPQNPTGNCWTEEEMTRMGEICLEHRVPVLADEIHCDFVTKGNSYTPFASLDPRIVDNSVTFKSNSKTFSLAANKVAWYFSTNPDYLERIRENTRADLSTLGMIAARAALDEGEGWLDQLLVYLDESHDFTEAYIGERVPMVRYSKAEGTFLAWLDMSELADRIDAQGKADHENKTAVDPVTPETVLQRWLAENARIYLNPGPSYGTGGAGHMRMNIATSRKLLGRALDNLSGAIAEL